MKVSEIALAAGVDAPVQFVELRDDAAEPFPALTAPYKIVVYDGGGTRVGAVDVTMGLTNYLSTEPYTVSTGAPADQALTVTLPAASGQVCFTNGAGETKVHCIAYGCPTTVFPGAQSGQVPALGQSLQRLSATDLALGAPTPDAANTAATPAACPGGGGGGGGGGADDHTPPSERLSGKRRQDVDKLAIGVVLSEAGSVTVGGSVSVPGASKTYRIKSVRRSVQANVRTTVKLKLSKKAKRAVKRAIARGRTIRARLSIAATDTAGNKSTARKTVRLTN
jgi:hypothetical protein